MLSGFVSFEGIDGSGKTTVSRLVARILRARGQVVFLTSEPTKGWLGRAVRRAVDEDIGAVAESFLFLADRAVHVGQIRVHLATGGLVVCDRYADSTYAYQGARLAEVLPDPIRILRQASQGWLLPPDLTILLRISPEAAMKRIEGRPTKVRFEDLSFLRKVAANYDRLARSRRFVVLDGSRPADVVATDAVAAILRRLKPRRAW